MSTTSRTSLLRRLIGLPAQRPAVLHDDACDMGTAIGLDYSLDQAPLAKAKPSKAGQSAARSSWGRRRQA